VLLLTVSFLVARQYNDCNGFANLGLRLAVAVAMSYKSPFILPPPHQRKAADEAKVRLSQGSESDQLTVHYALELRAQSRFSINEFCKKNFLSTNTIQMISEIRKNLTRELSALGFPSPSAVGKGNNNVAPYHNRHDKDHALWHAAIAAGLYPNVAFRKRGDTNFSTMTNQKVKVHVSSVNAIKGQPMNSKCDAPKGQLEFVCFGEMVKGTAHSFFTVNQTTHLASPLPLLLLCGTSLSVRPAQEMDGGEDGNKKPAKTAILTLDNWIIFQCEADVAANLVVLRKRLDTTFWNALAKTKKGKTPGDTKNLLAQLDPQEKDVLEILGPLLQSAHIQSESTKPRSAGVTSNSSNRGRR
jgi:Oligonucleotide/oligosaccharide-binding (OB)-fold